MKNQVARFTGGVNSTLEVQLTTGKKGQNVRVSVRTPGEKTQTGCRNLFTEPAKATAKFDALVADALKRGWIAKAPRNAFTEVPAPPTGKTAAPRKKE
jgi:hypothetical protein